MTNQRAKKYPYLTGIYIENGKGSPKKPEVEGSRDKILFDHRRFFETEV